jgi:hypothetical protein
VREDGRIIGTEGWQEKLRNREKWKKLLRMVRELSLCVHADGINKRMVNLFIFVLCGNINTDDNLKV